MAPQTVLYDTLSCACPFPDSRYDYSKVEFRTKAFERILAHYRVSESGQLQLYVPSGRVFVDAPVTGVVKFGAMLEKVWHEFDADFVNGSLKKLTRIKG